jgi:hypothetical protein
MTKFADQLYADLLREHGSTLAQIRPPATARRHIASRRALLATGAGGLAVAATAGALTATAGGTPAAYALTTHPDGTVTLAVYQAPGVAQANAQLRHLGDNVVVVPVHPWCPSLDSLRPPVASTKGKMISVQSGGSGHGSITVNARGVPAGDILVVGAETTVRGNQVTSQMGSRLTSPPAPSCVSLPAPPSGPWSGNAGGPGFGSASGSGHGPGGPGGPGSHVAHGGRSGSSVSHND